MPRAIAHFQWLLFAALVIDLANNVIAWPGMAATLAARGVAVGPGIMLLAWFASPAVGLVLWYFIARRRSVVAKWIMTALIAIGVLGFVAATLRAPGLPLLLVLGLAGEALKVAAVTRLFTAQAKAWLGG